MSVSQVYVPRVAFRSTTIDINGLDVVVDFYCQRGGDGESAVDMKFVLRKLPKAHTSLIKKLSIVSRGRFRNGVNAGASITGNSIYVRVGNTDKEDVLFHEVGHFVYRDLLSSKDKAFWRDMWKECDLPTLYSYDSSVEFFCECYAIYYQHLGSNLDEFILDWFKEYLDNDKGKIND